MNVKPIATDPHYTVDTSGNVTNTRTGKTLKPWRKNKGNYAVVQLPSGRKYVHKLVYETFIGEAPEGYVISHYDRDRKNNHVDNVYLTTKSELVTAAFLRKHTGK